VIEGKGEEDGDVDADALVVEVVRDVGALVVELETLRMDVEAEELDIELVVGDCTLLELDPITGLRLLYIDNRFAPPHYGN
jgi:hypothetical protein